MHVRGDYFIRLDDDNIFTNQFIAKAIKMIKIKKLDMVIYSPLIIDTYEKKYLLFNRDNNFYVLKGLELAYLEFYAMTDSNYALYSCRLLGDIMRQGGDLYLTTLPDRYLNYRIAESIENNKTQVGFSTEPLGVTRFDYRQRNSNNYTLKYYNYTDKILSNVEPIAQDCQSNFQMHRLLTLKYYFNKHSSLFQNYFESNILSKKNYLIYLELGHISESKQEYSLDELVIYIKFSLNILYNLLKHPIIKIDRKFNIIVFMELLLSIIHHLFRSTYSILFKKIRYGDKINKKFGDEICINIINGQYNILEKKGKFKSIIDIFKSLDSSSN